MDYFVGAYFEGSFSLEMWNNFDTNGTPRTNSNLEGYNSKLNKHIGVLALTFLRLLISLKRKK